MFGALSAVFGALVHTLQHRRSHQTMKVTFVSDVSVLCLLPSFPSLVPYGAVDLHPRLRSCPVIARSLSLPRHSLFPSGSTLGTFSVFQPLLSFDVYWDSI